MMKQYVSHKLCFFAITCFKTFHPFKNDPSMERMFPSQVDFFNQYQVMVFIPPKELWEAYSIHNVHPKCQSVHPSVYPSVIIRRLALCLMHTRGDPEIHGKVLYIFLLIKQSL